MADDQAQQKQQAEVQDENAQTLDPVFFECVNEYLQVTNRQSQLHGVQRSSLASVFAAARFNAHAYLVSVKPIHAASERKDFLEHMSTMFRRMLNEHLDGLGQERGIDVGVSELAEEYAAAGIQIARPAASTPASDYVSAAGAVPPAEPANE